MVLGKELRFSWESWFRKRGHDSETPFLDVRDVRPRLPERVGPATSAPAVFLVMEGGTLQCPPREGRTVKGHKEATTKYQAAVRSKELDVHLATRIDLENVVLSEKGKTMKFTAQCHLWW